MERINELWDDRGRRVGSQCEQGYERAALLRKVAALLVERADGIAEIMSRETGKASGIGREGPRYAMRDMTEERLVLFNL